MRYNKKYIRFDENGVAFPVMKSEKWIGKWYDVAHYHYAILNLFESGQVSKLTFYLDGKNKNYLVTIDVKDLKISKTIHFREDGSKYACTWSEFVKGGHLVEFLSFFQDEENSWMKDNDIYFNVYDVNIYN